MQGKALLMFAMKTTFLLDPRDVIITSRMAVCELVDNYNVLSLSHGDSVTYMLYI